MQKAQTKILRTTRDGINPSHGLSLTKKVHLSARKTHRNRRPARRKS